MKIKALVGAAALAALVASSAVAYAQDAGTMAPIPNPPEAPKAHHGGKHHHAAKHHKAHKASKAAAPAAK